MAAGVGAYSADKQKKAMRDAQGNATVDIERALAEARSQQEDYADIGKRNGLYKLAALMGDDRFGSEEAMELYDLKKPELVLPEQPGQSYGGTLGKLTGKKKKVNAAWDRYIGEKKRAEEKYAAELSAYNARKAELEGIVASQRGTDQYRVGADYLADSDSYKFRYGQGQKNTLRALSANRGVLGGGALKDLEEYGQQFASNEFNNEFNRLATMAGIGQNAATAIGNAATGAGTNLANLALQGGQTMSDYYGNMNNVAQGSIGNAAYLNDRRRSSYQRSPYSGWADYEQDREG